jgi:hypothetical protein
MTPDTKRIEADSHTPTQQTQRHITSLLDDLPAETLILVERFVEFLHEQARQGRSVALISEQQEQPPYRYPTIPVPASTLDAWMNLLLEGYEGDALADSEAVWDEVYQVNQP